MNRRAFFTRCLPAAAAATVTVPPAAPTNAITLDALFCPACGWQQPFPRRDEFTDENHGEWLLALTKPMDYTCYNDNCDWTGRVTFGRRV
jgi:hypothetical protein